MGHGLSGETERPIETNVRILDYFWSRYSRVYSTQFRLVLRAAGITHSHGPGKLCALRLRSNSKTSPVPLRTSTVSPVSGRPYKLV
jgi:hypothetical protein